MTKMVKLKITLWSKSGSSVSFDCWRPDLHGELNVMSEHLRLWAQSVGKPGEVTVHFECIDSRAFLVTDAEASAGGAN